MDDSDPLNLLGSFEASDAFHNLNVLYTDQAKQAEGRRICIGGRWMEERKHGALNIPPHSTPGSSLPLQREYPTAEKYVLSLILLPCCSADLTKALTAPANPLQIAVVFSKTETRARRTRTGISLISNSESSLLPSDHRSPTPSCTAEVGLKTEKQKKRKGERHYRKTADPLEY